MRELAFPNKENPHCRPSMRFAGFLLSCYSSTGRSCRRGWDQQQTAPRPVHAFDPAEHVSRGSTTPCFTA
jgi:hypothetical protein